MAFGVAFRWLYELGGLFTALGDFPGENWLFDGRNGRFDGEVGEKKPSGEGFTFRGGVWNILLIMCDVRCDRRLMQTCDENICENMPASWLSQR